MLQAPARYLYPCGVSSFPGSIVHVFEDIAMDECSDENSCKHIGANLSHDITNHLFAEVDALCATIRSAERF